MNKMKILLARSFLCSILSVMISSSFSQEPVITPEVSILDETPSYHTGRIVELANKTVLIKGLVGERVVVQCNVFNMPQDGRIVWRRESLVNKQLQEIINDGLMSRDMSRWKIGQGKQQNSIRLEIFSLDQTYEGLYTCECQYTGSVEPARVRRMLLVYEKPTIVRHMSSYNTEETAGSLVVLRCAAAGIPKPVIYWQRAGGPSSIIRNYGTQMNGNEIRFEQVEANDAGEYVCFAENSMGQALWRVQLSVKHPPIIRIFPMQPMQKVGCRLRLWCTIDANPPVLEDSCSWTSDRTGAISASTPGTKLKYLNAGLTRHLVLDLLPVKSSDFGQKLTCSATNEDGIATATVTVLESAQDVPLINGQYAC